MRNFFQAFLSLCIITVVGTALYVFFTDKKIIVLNDDTLRTVDEIWLTGDSLFYEIDGQIDFLDDSEIKTFGKRNLRHVFIGAKRTLLENLDQLENSINPILKKNHIPIKLNLTHPLILLPLFLLVLIPLWLRRTIKSGPKAIHKKTDHENS
jgi:hypothetical protein